MKDKIHPTYQECTVVCACGATVKTRSTKPNIHVEICSQCHPFFTGKQKLVDSAGRVDKFKKRYEKKKPKKEKGDEASQTGTTQEKSFSEKLDDINKDRSPEKEKNA